MTYFYERIGNFPDRIKNLHLLYAFVLKAVTLSQDTILRQDYKTGFEKLSDAITPALVRSLLQKITVECDEPFKER